MKKILTLITFAAGLLSLNVYAQVYRGYTLTANQVCASSNGVVQTVNPGFTPPGYFNVDDFTGSTIRYQNTTLFNYGFTIVSPQDRVTVRYANGSNFTRVMSLRLSSGQVLIPSMAFPPTGGWSTWKEVQFLPMS